MVVLYSTLNPRVYKSTLSIVPSVLNPPKKGRKNQARAEGHRRLLAKKCVVDTPALQLFSMSMEGKPSTKSPGGVKTHSMSEVGEALNRDDLLRYFSLCWKCLGHVCNMSATQIFQLDSRHIYWSPVATFPDMPQHVSKCQQVGTA